MTLTVKKSNNWRRKICKWRNKLLVKGQVLFILWTIASSLSAQTLEQREALTHTETIHPVLSYICIHWIVPIFITFCYLLNGILMCLTVFSINSYSVKKAAVIFFSPILMLQFWFLDAILYSLKYIMLAVMGYWILEMHEQFEIRHRDQIFKLTVTVSRQLLTSKNKQD